MENFPGSPKYDVKHWATILCNLESRIGVSCGDKSYPCLDGNIFNVLVYSMDKISIIKTNNE